MNHSDLPSDEQGGSRRLLWILCASLAVTLTVFYAFVPKFSVGNVNPTVTWLIESWNMENKNYEHGWIVVLVMGWFIYRAWAPMKKEPVAGSLTGLWWVALGIFLWVGGFRAIQARAAVLSLPCFILGGVHFACGWKMARHLVFPLSLVAFMIPMPGIEQATNGLAIFATKMAHKFGLLIGIETIQSGTKLLAPPGQSWGEWQVDDGCSGLRSLVALMLISYAYGMVIHRKWWERIVVFAAAIPIAIVANGFRITSILVVAQISQKFAGATWHNYSGFFSFGAALALLMLLSFVMRQGVRALKPKLKVTRVGDAKE
ncbi:MAG TPA: exosortase/archaeosortase family protein [Verrucomicrobiales bacterium]|jgi:exosortase|nr:exosortase/archaeosortase family protein [Verrucomicrobiales bacterium]